MDQAVAPGNLIRHGSIEPRIKTDRPQNENPCQDEPNAGHADCYRPDAFDDPGSKSTAHLPYFCISVRLAEAVMSGIAAIARTAIILILSSDTAIACSCSKATICGLIHASTIFVGEVIDEGVSPHEAGIKPIEQDFVATP